MMPCGVKASRSGGKEFSYKGSLFFSFSNVFTRSSALHNLGTAYLYRRDIYKMIEHITAQLRIYQEIERISRIVSGLYDIGMILSYVGDVVTVAVCSLPWNRLK